MDWLIEHDAEGLPTRMVYVPVLWAKQNRIDSHEIVRDPPCECGFRFGWHALGCKLRESRR